MNDGRTRIIKQPWRTVGARRIAPILGGVSEPEGFSVERQQVDAPGVLAPSSEGRIVSLLAGGARGVDPTHGRLQFSAGTHLYVPAGRELALELEAGTSLVLLSANRDAGSAARGEELIVRSERFLAGCATETQMLRWTLTPQYVSRRIFLHHDRTLVSKSGDPVSWFRTTMFDVDGLPANDDGEPVFKMSYNSRTEFNVLYDVRGDCKVRFAEHPYRDEGQTWGPWHSLDGETTYHLCEPRSLGTPRNKHEVSALDGHVSLFCLFDPAPTGVERHRPGAYSDYEPYDVVSKRAEFATHQSTVAPFDAMVDALSLATARGVDVDAEPSLREHVERYRAGLEAQIALEAAVVEENTGRAAILAPWRVALSHEPPIFMAG